MKPRIEFEIGVTDSYNTKIYAIAERYHTTSDEMVHLVHEASRRIIGTIRTIQSWKRAFAIFPVSLKEGGWTWMRPVWTRAVDRSQPYCAIFRRQYTDDPKQDYR